MSKGLCAAYQLKQASYAPVDSGASLSLISQSMVNQSKYLSSLPQNDVSPRTIKIANGSYITTTKGLKITIKINGHEMRISPYIVPTMGLIPCLLGSADLASIGASLDFSTNVLRFRKPKNTSLKVVNNITLHPGQSRTVMLTGRLPKSLKCGDAVLTSTRFADKVAPHRMLVTLENGRCIIPVTNTSARSITLKPDKAMAYVDFSSSFNAFLPVSEIRQSNKETVFYIDCTNGTTSFTQNNGNATMSKDSCNRVTETHNRNNIYAQKERLYPHLDKDDSRLRMTDEEIIDRDINLSTPDSTLNPSEITEFKQMLYKRKAAFSLHGEIGQCDYEVKFDLTEKTPFYIRPYHASEADKKVIDRELEKLVQLGVLKKGLATSSSPIMLVDKKNQTGAKRVVADLRHLNSKIYRQNWPFPLIRDTIQKIGASNCKVFSIIDLKDAFHSLRLSKECQRYCGVTSYFGGKSYYYTRCPQGASISPAAFQQFIDSVLDCMPELRDYVVAHTDDVLLFSGSTLEHKRMVDRLLSVLEEKGLKISPTKAQFFRRTVNYMGHVLTIKDGKPHIKPMKPKCDAIMRLQQPTTPKETRRFIGAVNFLSMYLPQLHKLLKPMYDLTKRKRKFEWTETHQTNFEEIKKLLSAPPVLVMPNATGNLILYSDTSRVATGASLWQIQDGVKRLVAYHSKSLPAAAQRYGVSELELTGLYLNVMAFRHILKSTHFTAFVDHSALVNILKSKKEPPTIRMRKLIERLSDFSFDLQYQKGSSLVLSDLLSRSCEPTDESLADVTPVACVSGDAPARRITRGYAKQEGITVTDMTKQNQEILTNRRRRRCNTQSPGASGENQNEGDKQPVVSVSSTKQTFIPPVDISPPAANLRTPLIQDDELNTRPVTRTLVGQQLQSQKDGDHLQVPLTSLVPRNTELIQATSPPNDIHVSPPSQLFRTPEPLFTQLPASDVMCKHVPRQKEIDRLLTVIRTKCLRDFSLPLKAAEIKLEQQKSPDFKHIYTYLASGILPSKSRSARSVMNQAENFLLIQGILFKLDMASDSSDCKLTLCIPESQAAYIISLYHDSLLASHQGVNRTFVTLRKKFYIPRLYDKLTAYIKSCAICQQRRIPTKAEMGKPYQPRIFSEYAPFDELHLDIKSLFPSTDNFTHLLVCVCAQTRYVIAVPLRRTDAISVAEAIVQRIVFTFGVPKRIVTDEGKSFANAVLGHILRTLQIDPKFISPHNHGSLMAERSIQSISRLLTNHLSDHGRSWPLYIQAVCFAHNTFVHSLLGYSPFELAFGRKPPDVLNVTLTPGDVPVTYQDYVQRLQDKFNRIGKVFLDMQTHNQNTQAAKRMHDIKSLSTFSEGQLVYFLMPSATNLDTNTRSFTVSYVGPLKIHAMLDATHCILSDLQGTLIHGVHHTNRIKPCFLRTTTGNVSHVDSLRKALQKDVTNASNTQTAVVTDEYGCALLAATDDCFIYKAHKDESFLASQVTGASSSSDVQNNEVAKLLDTDLSAYLANETANNGIAAVKCLSTDSKTRLLNHLDSMPETNTRLTATKARLKDGHLEVLFSAKNFSAWFRLDIHPCLKRLWQDKSPRIRVSGSARRFLKSLI